MKEISFVPLVDAQPIVDEDGKVVKVDVQVPKHASDVTMQTWVDGQEVKDQYLLPSKVYDVLKWVGLLLLPTLAWVYTMLASAWNLPYAEQVPFTLNVLGTMIAVLIGASSLNNAVKGA